VDAPLGRLRLLGQKEGGRPSLKRKNHFLFVFQMNSQANPFLIKHFQDLIPK
jgi:hypothetical protein